jgi:predicted metal-dependent RNase
MSWVKVEVSGLLQQPRAGHCAAFDEKKMLVFGGYNAEGFLKGEIQSLELDSRVASKMNKLITI